jgi:D-arabinose 1-dehydrogenase-like Zn-dependent alcohol dehydrogenase
MKAARVKDGEITIFDDPSPEPAADYARVRITSAGVCHSDLHLAKGDWGFPGEGAPLGHEAIGIVEALGPGAERFVSVGDRVILGLGGAGGGPWCGACEYCIAGAPNHCVHGGALMGTFAEEFCAFAPGLVSIPDSIPDHEAPLACGGLTAYGAVKKLTKHGITPGRWIAIVGAAGGLGHYAVQIASAFGYRVIGIDMGEERLEFVRSLGAERALSVDEAPEVIANEFGGVNASLVFAARIAGYQLGYSILRKKGLFVGVGLPALEDGNFQITPMDMLMREATVIFSAVGTVQDMRELVDLASRGIVKTHVGRTGAMSELGAIFEELQTASYLGRGVVTDMSS